MGHSIGGLVGRYPIDRSADDPARAGWRDEDPTRYPAIHGDIGGGTDGVVRVVSALALPLFPPETSAAFFATHDELHALAGTSGVTSRIVQLLQVP